MKFLVTGSRGLLGQRLISRIISDEKHSCIAGYREIPPGRPDSRAIHPVKMDILDHSETGRVIEEFKPDVVINAAAMTQADDCEKNRELCYGINVEAVSTMAEICRKREIHLVQLSTDFVFNGKDGPYLEEDLPDPVNYYGKTNQLSEELLFRLLPGAAIIRTILVYGVNPVMSRSNILLWVKEKLEKKETIKVVDDQVRNPTYVDDLAQACISAAILRKSGIFHIGGREFLTPFRFAGLIADYYGLDKSLIIPVNADIFSQPAMRPLRTGLLTMKAEKELGYSPHFIREGLDLIKEEMKGYQLQ